MEHEHGLEARRLSSGTFPGQNLPEASMPLFSVSVKIEKFVHVRHETSQTLNAEPEILDILEENRGVNV